MTEIEIKEWMDHELTMDWLRTQDPVDAMVHATVMNCKALFRNLLEAESRIECAMAVNDFALALKEGLRRLISIHASARRQGEPAVEEVARFVESMDRSTHPAEIADAIRARYNNGGTK